MSRPSSNGPQPADIAKAGSEHAEQVALFCWAALQFPKYPELRLMFAIPVGGERNKIVASRLKAEGVKAGTPDIFLPVARGGYHGLFIELKKTGGKASPMQKETIAALLKQGYAAGVCVGWELASQWIIYYLGQSNG